MRIEEVRELYGHIDACSYVTKGESDSREVHGKFKIVCGLNLEIIQGEFDKYAAESAKKYKELVHPDYEVFMDKAEKAQDRKDATKHIKMLEDKYRDAIKTYETYLQWLEDVFYKQEVETPAFKMWPFEDMPEKIAGGYMLAIKPMISGFPEFD